MGQGFNCCADRIKEEQYSASRDQIKPESQNFDSIPPSVKKDFFTGVRPPNFSRDYDAIGFDADMCLVKYNVKAFYCLFVKIMLEELHQKHNYPDEILNFDYKDEESEDLKIMMNSMIFDFNTGILLKLGEDKRILVALRGRRVMALDEVQKVYGSPVPKFEPIDWPTTDLFNEKAKFYGFNSYFYVMDYIPLLLSIELIDQGKLDKTYMQLMGDVMACLDAIYTLGKGDSYIPLRSKGRYYPEVVANPSKYIIAQPEMVDVLLKLREQGKFLFLATNSYFEYGDLIMEATLGPDWKKCFNMVFAFCDKPKFFSYDNEVTMYQITYDSKDFIGNPISSFDQLSEEPGKNMFTSGSVKLIDQYLQQKLQKTVVKFAYFGDFYTSDIYWSAKNENWDGIVVIEEMSFKEQEFAKIQQACRLQPPIDMKLPQYADFLGDYFIHDPEKPCANYYVKNIEKSARYAVALVRHMSMMMDW